MRTELFDYLLPQERIAIRPPQQRDAGKMLVLSASPDGSASHDFRDAQVNEFVHYLEPGDLLILNQTRVRQARLKARRPTLPGGGGGGQVELLFLNPLQEGRWEALGKANRSLRVGDRLSAGQEELVVRARDAAGVLEIEVQGDLESLLVEEGEMPIPPYLNRESEPQDRQRYQTVFAEHLGSAAAPTAGLHLTEAALAQIQEKGVEVARLTLHVGVGTFRPVGVEDLDEHPMHSEWIDVSAETCAAVHRVKSQGGKVWAVGTTAVRALESAAQFTSEPSKSLGRLDPYRGQTDLLIQPGFEFLVVDGLLTNFHQPKSTLLALVSALTGRERLIAAYEHALNHDYRFLSYGDAMVILPENRSEVL
ncbi:MAG: tRNA preQ1(34) S-adenosylmethionine ribosyltransferase-isomerase QueA [Polyangiaceae bacterium]|nr:tRNA preQ1(34) S-adenosylmethionine ribosyltransferase-isomerase QueA [Polyangiaceae bacterium]